MTIENAMRIRIVGTAVKAEDLTFKIEVEPEFGEVRGNLGEFDTPEDQEEAEDLILDRLDKGDYWAWCTVWVSARHGSRVFRSSSLGCCSYRDEEDFKSGGYYEDMRDEVVKKVNQHLAMMNFVDEWAQSVDDLCAENDFDREEFTGLLHERYKIPF